MDVNGPFTSACLFPYFRSSDIYTLENSFLHIKSYSRVCEWVIFRKLGGVKGTFI